MISDNFEQWTQNFKYTDIQKILRTEYNRITNQYKYFHSEKGKQKRKELNAKYYLKRKAMKELSE